MIIKAWPHIPAHSLWSEPWRSYKAISPAGKSVKGQTKANMEHWQVGVDRELQNHKGWSWCPWLVTCDLVWKTWIRQLQRKSVCYFKEGHMYIQTDWGKVVCTRILSRDELGVSWVIWLQRLVNPKMGQPQCLVTWSSISLPKQIAEI